MGDESVKERASKAAELPSSLNLPLADPPNYRLGELTEVERQKVTPGSNAIGVTRDVPAEAMGRGECLPLGDNQFVWRLQLTSPGAVAIRLHFTQFDSDMGKVWLHGLGSQAPIHGPYTSRGTFNDGDFWSNVIDGEAAVLVFEASGSCPRDVPFEIRELGHAWESPQATLPINKATSRQAIARCHSPFRCRPTDFAWQDSADSIAGITSFRNGEWRPWCTGTLLNTRSGRGPYYFLTANHCFSG
jgi:hypothetical protein